MTVRLCPFCKSEINQYPAVQICKKCSKEIIPDGYMNILIQQQQNSLNINCSLDINNENNIIVDYLDNKLNINIIDNIINSNLFVSLSEQTLSEFFYHTKKYYKLFDNEIKKELIGKVNNHHQRWWLECGL